MMRSRRPTEGGRKKRKGRLQTTRGESTSPSPAPWSAAVRPQHVVRLSTGRGLPRKVRKKSSQDTKVDEKL